MGSIKVLLAVVVAMAFIAAVQCRRWSVWRENFETKKLGIRWRGARDHVDLTEITSTLSSEGTPTKAVQIKYLKGKFGNESRVRYKVGLIKADSYTAEFQVKFGDNFDFNKGGKLPGLCGGSCSTGCTEMVADGWSSRFVWKNGNKLYLYIYDQDRYRNKKVRADNRYCGTVYYVNFDATPGEWVTLRQELKINSPNKYDGSIRVHVNGKETFFKDDFRFRGDTDTTEAQIDMFYFTTFFGGSTRDWAPSRDCYTYFDNFHVFKSTP